MLEIYNTNGQLYFKGDEKVLAKVEGEDLSGVEVPKVVSADELYTAYNSASREGRNPDGTPIIENAKYYAVCKEKYIEQFNKRNK